MRDLFGEDILGYVILLVVILVLVLGTHNVCTVNGDVFSRVASQQR